MSAILSIIAASRRRGSAIPANIDYGFVADAYSHRVTITPPGTVRNLAVGVHQTLFTGLAWNTAHSISNVGIDGALNESIPVIVDIWTQPEFGPTSFLATASSSSIISLTWTRPVDRPGGGGYEIQTSPDGIAWSVLDSADGDDAFYIVNGLTPSTLRYYRIRAINYNPAPHDNAFTVWSATTSATTTADVTPPVLTLATAVQTGPTTATVGFTTDDGTGTRYIFVTTSATAPSEAAMIAGTGAVYSESAVIGSPGVKTFFATGLTAGVTYYAYGFQKDAVGNSSNIIKSAAFVPSVSYLASADFAASGIPAGISTRAGTVDYNYPISGGYAARTTGKTDGSQAKFRIVYPIGNYRESYWQMTVTDAADGNAILVAQMLYGVSLIKASVYLRSGNFRLLSGGPSSLVGYTIGTKLHCWLTYDNATGIQTFAWSTDGTRPTSGSTFMTTTFTPTATGADNTTFLGEKNSSYSADVNFSKIRISDTTIGNNPS